MGRVLLLFTVLCSVLLAETAVDIQKKQAVIKRLGMCKGKGNLPMQWYDVVIGPDEHKDTAFALKVKLQREVSNNLCIAFSFWKCDAAGNPDSCEYVMKDYNNTEICDRIEDRNEAWSMFIDHFDKRPTCPIKPGVYNLRAMPIKTEFMKFLPVSDALWKLRLVATDLGVEVSCVEMLMQIGTSFTRNRNKS